VLRNEGGRYTPLSPGVLRHWSRLAFLSSGDLDRDGDLDLITGSDSGEPAVVWFNDGAGRLVAGPELVASRGPVAVLDGDLDGDLDLLVLDDDGSTWLLTAGEPRGPELAGWTDTVGTGVAGVGGALAALDGRLYAMGGRNGHPTRATLVATVDAAGALGAWQSTSAPTGRMDGAVLSYRGALFQAGGLNQPSVYVGVPEPNGTISAWQETTPLPEDRMRFAMAAWDGRLYVAGGHGPDGSSFGSVRHATVASDLTVGEWLPAVDLPAARRDVALAAHDGWLWALGGRSDGTGASQTATVFAAPIRPDGSLVEWTERTQLPAASFGHAAFVRGDHLYVVGGNAGGSAMSTVHTARLRPGGHLGAWVPGPRLPEPRAFLGVAAIGSTLYAIGGAGRLGNSDWAASARIR